MLKYHSNQLGFTLTEAVIAIAVLLIGLVAIFKFFPFGIQIIGNSNNISVASNIALSQMEATISTKYDSLATGTIEAKHRVTTDPTSYLYSYQRQTVVQTVDSNLNPSAIDIGIKEITVTVYWQSPITHTEHSIQIQSLLARG